MPLRFTAVISHATARHHLCFSMPQQSLTGSCNTAATPCPEYQYHSMPLLRPAGADHYFVLLSLCRSTLAVEWLSNANASLRFAGLRHSITPPICALPSRRYAVPSPCVTQRYSAMPLLPEICLASALQIIKTPRLAGASLTSLCSDVLCSADAQPRPHDTPHHPVRLCP